MSRVASDGDEEFGGGFELCISEEIAGIGGEYLGVFFLFVFSFWYFREAKLKGRTEANLGFGN